MRPIFALTLVAALLVVTPALAEAVTARVSGGTVSVRSGPGAGYPVVGRVGEGTEIPIDRCTGVDGDSRFGSWGDAGWPLRGAGARQWCRIPGLGWVDRTYIVGRGLIHVTPPDFLGPGW